MLNLILIIGFYLLVSGATPFYCPVKLRFCVRSNSCIVVRFRPIFANKWENLSVYFKYPKEIRKVIYTTNIIESVHRQFRKLTKTKGAFPNDNSLLKLLFMGIKNSEKNCTMPVWNWSLTLSQLAIFFEGRLDNELKI